jgi:hypothetical protein
MKKVRHKRAFLFVTAHKIGGENSRGVFLFWGYIGREKDQLFRNHIENEKP